MKKINIENVEEKIYYEKLNNGLEVYILPKKEMDDIYVTFTTKFGSLHNKFIPFGEKKYRKFPLGIAHFLEHKLFDQPDGTKVSSFFVENGAYSNAFTDFEQTAYLFEGSNKFIKNLEFLIDYVQNPYFTEESVEKEKGIIIEEIQMGKDKPNRNLFFSAFKQLFKQSNYKHRVIGDIENVNAITKKDLYDCYKTFYHPQNMFLVITGKVNLEKTIKVIKYNQRFKKFPKSFPIKIKESKEPLEVGKTHGEIKMSVDMPLLSFSIKVLKEQGNLTKRIKDSMYLEILFEMLFGFTSETFCDLREKKIISNYFNVFYRELEGNFDMVYIKNSTKSPTKLLKIIKDKIKNIKVSEEDFERQLKVYKSSILYKFDSIRSLNGWIRSDIINYGEIITNKLEILNSMNFEELNKIIEKTDFGNCTSFIIYPK